MARVDLAVQYPTSSGITPTYSAAEADGNSFDNPDGEAIVIFRNTNAAPRVVTVNTPGTVDGNAVADKTITIPAVTGEKHCRFPTSSYNQPSGTNAGKVLLDYDAVAGLTVAVIHH